jgi:glc operon protein GlcG
LILTAMMVLPSLAPAWGQQQPSPSSGVRDAAKLFGEAAVREADAQLERLARQHGLPIVIETVESLPQGDAVDEEARSRFEKAGSKALYVLIARREAKTSLAHAPKSIESRLGQAKLAAIRDSFTEDFRQRRFDEGLRTAVATIGKSLEGVTTGPELVLRDQVRLNLAGAKAVIAAAEAKAAEMGLKVNIAVVDDGGHPLAFARMDGARPASAYTALTKATSAATTRLATGPIPAGTTTPDLLLNLSIQNAATASGGKFTTLYGGVPITVDGQVIGAVGVGGGTGEEDAVVAKAGVAALLKQVGGP